jgi:hypothetical protein
MIGARGPPPILPSNAAPKSSAAASVSRELEDCSSTGLQHRFCAVAVDDVVDIVGECGCDFVGRIAGETGGRRSMQAQRPSRSDMPPASSMAVFAAIEAYNEDD